MTRSTPTVLVRLCMLLLASCLLAGCGWLETTGQASDVNDSRRPNADTLYTMGRILASQGRVDEAMFVYNRVVAEYPEFRPVYSDMADLYLRTGRYDHALQLMTHALDRWPNDPILSNNMGMCHLATRNYEPALQHFARAAELAPQVIAYRANHAVTLGLMGQYDQALAAYKQFLSPGEAHYNLAILAESRGDHDRAQQYHALAQANGFKAP